MNKEWFILIDGKQEGPYSPNELKLNARVTPDTLVWKKGFKNWTPLRYVAELQDIFKDEPESKPLHEKAKLPPSHLPSEQEALALQNDPPQFFLWLIVIALILVYIFYQLNRF